MNEDRQQEMQEIPNAPEPRRFNELSVLFPLLSLYTITYLVAITAKFFMGNSLTLPDGIMQIYMALLGAYATDKEIRRWMGRPEPPRKGTVFVYLWLLLFLVLFVVQTLKPAYKMPEYTVAICLQVLGIFFGSKASKHIHGRRASQADLNLSRQEKVLALIKANGSVTRPMVEDELKLASSSVKRLLSEMEKQGLIEKQGQSKETSYILPKAHPPA